MTFETATAKPNRDAVLAKLRPFQRRAVSHIIKNLFAQGSRGRFLVADEVGLGKTLVARGVIAEVIEKHWEDVGRIDILYVCSNQALARENLRKLHIGGRLISGTRLTLLPIENQDSNGRYDDRLNFISLTPGTALRTEGYGLAEERKVLYVLLREYFGQGDRAWLKNLLQGGVGMENWRNHELKRLPKLDRELSEIFRERLEKDQYLNEELDWASETLIRHDTRLDEDGRRRRRLLVSDLRNLLAFTCLDDLQPDLIILDEFQRFKDLLTTSEDEQDSGDANELARSLFEYTTPEGHRVATLLLSATPYRMYTTDDEALTEDHYEDFLATLRFLIDDEDGFRKAQRSLDAYRQALFASVSGSPGGIGEARRELEGVLKRVMVRMERTQSSEERDAMVEEKLVSAPIERRDLAQFLATQELSEELGAGDIVEYWKSAPYLLNFMKNYELKRELEKRRRRKGIREAFQKHEQEFLSEEDIRDYRAIDPANARLRALAAHTLGGGQWGMLWLPPTVPYWPLEGAFRGQEGFSKSLVFSAWNVVPDAVSALLSYEAERKMVEGDKETDYLALYRSGQLLKADSMSTLALALPCFALADGISPLDFAVRGEEVVESAKSEVSRLLDMLKPFEKGGQADRRWEWAAPLLLDRDDESLRALLEGWTTTVSGEDDGEGVGQCIKEALRLLDGEIELGRMPSSLVDTITSLALGGPAIVMARALNHRGISPSERRRSSARIAGAFRTLFNRPAVARMLRAEGEDTYWKRTLSYAIEGNLQAVMDEYIHLLWEQASRDDSVPDDICDEIAEIVGEALTLRVSRIVPDIYSTGEHQIEELETENAEGLKEKLSIRTSFALRYGRGLSHDERGEIREENIRTAFKSPFQPFVLISTSVGQEGLDFHPYCHDIWHWNLPGNPVDLEQREGRVHRYKSLAVRKNIALDALAVLKESWDIETDPWDRLFSEAERRDGHRGELVPYWMAPGPHKVRRCVPLLPFSSEISALRRLKRSLALYRLVFGQPRQEELLELLASSGFCEKDVEKWTLSLQADSE